VSQRPQRPFVPHRTPKESREQTAPAEFRIAQPFVHRGARARENPPASISDFLAVDEAASSESVSEAPASISAFFADEPAPISDFMRVDPPASIADFLAPETSFETMSPVDDSYELPPIEHFTEAVEDQGMYTRAGSVAERGDPFASGEPEAEADSFGWEETDWQRYDWRSAAALGETSDPEASSAWAQTDWGIAGSPQPRDSRESAARAIADALDGIARRIREGDLVIPPAPSAVPDPATIAATLAALLGVKR
jgi:hypothetical protein